MAYSPHTGILSIARARCELCCYINLNFSVKMSNVSEHSEFDYPKKKKKKKEKRGGHIIKCLLTELGQAVQEIFGPRSWCTDLAALGPYTMTSG